MSDKKKDLFVPEKIDEEVEKIDGAYEPKKSIDDSFDKMYKSEVKRHNRSKEKLLDELRGCYSDFCDHYNFVNEEFEKVANFFYNVQRDLDNWEMSYRDDKSNGPINLKKPGYTITGRPDYDEYYFLVEFKNKDTGNSIVDSIKYSCQIGISEAHFNFDRGAKHHVFPELDMDKLDFEFKGANITKVKKYLSSAKTGVSSMNASLVDVSVTTNYKSMTPSLHFKSKDMKGVTLEKLSKMLLLKMFNEEDFKLQDVIDEALK